MAKIELAVAVDGATPAEAEEFVVRLRRDLQELALDKVERTRKRDEPPPGSRADSAMLSDLVITIAGSAAAMTSVAQVLVAWINRSTGRSVSLSDGQRTVTVNGASKCQIDDLLREFAGADPPDESTLA